MIRVAEDHKQSGNNKKGAKKASKYRMKVGRKREDWNTRGEREVKRASNNETNGRKKTNTYTGNDERKKTTENMNSAVSAKCYTNNQSGITTDAEGRKTKQRKNEREKLV